MLQWKSTMRSFFLLSYSSFSSTKKIYQVLHNDAFMAHLFRQKQRSSRNVPDAAMTQKKVYTYIGCCLTQYTVSNKLNFTTGNSSCWSTILRFIGYSPWWWHSKGWNMLELRKVLIKWRLNYLWVNLLVLIRYSDFSARIWTK